ncbi:UMP kinase [Candidatus Bathyarchaeota archaeon]|nr:UMP kinase [Candidatus Bathyarchaeota archaeon]
MKVVISLGGSLLTRELSAENFRRYAEVLKELWRRGHRLVVVCGGGRTARRYQELARVLGADQRMLDRVGVLGTHLNALLLITALGEAADERIFKRASDVKRHFGDRILVGGGYLPGCSTDYRAALFARAVGADLIVNATDYGGVFDKDPRRHPDARQYDRLSFEEFEEIIKRRFEQKPGDYGLFDLKATRLIRKHRIRTVIIDGTDPWEILRAVEGGHSGTVIE